MKFKKKNQIKKYMWIKILSIDTKKELIHSSEETETRKKQSITKGKKTITKGKKNNKREKKQ